MSDTNRLGPRDVFMHLAAIIGLYFSAVNLGVIVFKLLDIYLPDVVSDSYIYLPGVYNTIRWAVATLVIVFPVYVWLNWFLERELSRVPEKRELRTRKWLIYLTLFLAAGVIIGDLVTLVYNFLDGELTWRFILKVSTVFIIAAAIFRYYLWSLRAAFDSVKGSWREIFVGAVAVLVAVVLVAGFWTAGLPKSQRLAKLDERRVNHLESIKSQLIYYWQQKGELPDSLNQLSDSFSADQTPIDPETKQPYGYKKLDSLKFQLCANFDTEYKGEPDFRRKPYYLHPSVSMENWEHDAGYFCFTRAIDPQMYGPRGPQAESIPVAPPMK